MFRRSRLPTRRERQAPAAGGLHAALLAGLFGLAGVLWIFLSDRIVAAYAADPGQLTAIQTWKGWGYVLLSTALVYVLIRLVRRNEAGRLAMAERSNRSEERFRSYVENAPVAVMVCDGQGRYVDSNPAATQMLGFEPVQMQGMYVTGLVPGDEREAVRRDFAAVSRAGNIEGEYRLRRRDGEVIWAAVRAVRISDDRIMAFCQDITRARRADEALRESERALREAQEIARVGSYVYDIGGDRWTSSAVLDEILGIDAAFPRTAAGWAGVVHADERAEMVAYLRDVVARHLRFEKEYRIVRRCDGAQRWVLGLGEVEYGPDGAPRRMVGAIQDITERVRAEQALRESEQHLEKLVLARTAALEEAEAQTRLILESTADGLFGLDTGGCITFINPAACKLLGFDAPALIGRHARTALRHSRADGSLHPLESCPMDITLRQGRVMRCDSEVFWRADGTAFPVAYACEPMVRHGRIVGAVVSFMDITGRKAVEAAREQAVAEAERLARARSEFLANMSHEIRTPLNAVLGLAQVGMRDSVGRKSNDTFGRILDAGQHLLGIINDILDFSKIEAGKFALEQAYFTLGDALDRAVEMVAARAYAKDLDFRVEEAADLPLSCRGDALRLSQVLVNLLSNAVKFTPAGGWVVLAARREAATLVLRVSDSGVGMAQEHLARLFQPFEQADGSTTRRFGGTGLGLSISRHLVDLMGGGIAVASRPGEGSTFEVRLPLRGAGLAAAPVAGSVSVPGMGEAERAALAAMLAAHGVPVIAASPGAVPPATTLLLVPARSLDAEDGRAVVEQALALGRRVALLATPGEAGVPAELRERLRVLERPLRARHVLAALATPAARELRPRPAGGARLRGYRVLAAEDNEVNRLVLEELLKGEGARLECVDNGRAAVEVLQARGAGAFDVVLTDIQMPEMDGYETARRMRQLAAELPVMGLTAHAMPGERARCLEAGMVEHVVKPVDLDVLVAAILRHTRRRGGAAGNDGAGEGSAPAARGAVSSGLVDWAALERQFKGKHAFVTRLAATVIQSNADTPARLRDLALRQDTDALAFAAHSIKGMAGSLTAHEVRALAAKLEAAARSHEPDTPALAAQLADALDELLLVLAARMDRRDEAPTQAGH